MLFKQGDVVIVSTIQETHKAIVVRVDDPIRAIVVKIHYYNNPSMKSVRMPCYASELIPNAIGSFR